MRALMADALGVLLCLVEKKESFDRLDFSTAVSVVVTLLSGCCLKSTYQSTYCLLCSVRDNRKGKDKIISIMSAAQQMADGRWQTCLCHLL